MPDATFVEMKGPTKEKKYEQYIHWLASTVTGMLGGSYQLVPASGW